MRLSYAWRQLLVAWRRWGEVVRRVGVAIWVLRFMMLTPTPLAADPAGSTTKSQDLRVQDVLIEGKLYSPQALFILSRPAEQFGSEAVLPHYLGRRVPYRCHSPLPTRPWRNWGRPAAPDPGFPRSPVSSQ